MTALNTGELPAESEIRVPDIKVSVRQLFGFDTNLEVPAFSQVGEHVPDLDEDYLFNRETTLAILAGFAYNRRVMITGYHGTGKSTHIEQVAARLNWPCIRVNLDSHISRIDLIGKDAIVLKDGKQITEFREGILPWAYQHNVALVFDEYDAGRPDVMFVIQRVLEMLRPPDAARPEPGASGRIPPSGCSPPPTPSASATPPASITAPSRSTRPRWTAGRSSLPSTICRMPRKAASCWPSQELRHRQGPQDHRQHGAGRRPHPQRLHAGRPLDRDEPAHRHHLGPECRDLRRSRLCASASPSSTSATSSSAAWWPSSISAASARSCRNRPPMSRSPER